MNLKYTLSAFLSHWKLICSVPAVALLLTYGLLQIISPTYQSTAEVLVFDPHRQVNSAAQRPISPLDINTLAINTEIQVIRSKSVLAAVVKRLHLDTDPLFQSRSRLSLLLQRFGLAETREPTGADNSERDAGAATADLVERTAASLDQSLRVEQIGFSYVLGITVEAREPKLAQRVTAMVATEYLNAQRKARLEQMQQVADWLRSEVDGLGNRVVSTETAIEKLKGDGGFTSAGSTSLSEQQISDLNSQLIAARAATIKQRTTLEQAQRVLANHGDVTAIPEVMASAVVAQLLQQRSSLIQQRSDFLSTLGTAAGEANAIFARRLARINEEINDEAVHIVSDVKNAYEAALRNEQSLQASLEQLTNGIANSPDYIRLKQLERVAKAERQLYESYLTQFNEITTQQGFQDASPQIISPALLPIAPSKPRRVLFYSLGGVLGLSFGFAGAFLLEYFRSSVRTRGEAEDKFGYPVLGVIPFVPSSTRRQRVEPGFLMRTIIDAPLSEMGEAVQAARIALRKSDSGELAKVILITSSIIGEGKSTFAMLISASSVASGQSTVLVDCDLRRRTTSRAFGMPEPGLIDLLNGNADLEDVITIGSSTQPHVISAGSSMGNPADLLTSQHMDDLIMQLRTRYDTIVLDVSPVLAVVDAVALAPSVDKVIVMVEWNRTPGDVVAETLRLLEGNRCNVAGVVLNKVNLKQLRTYDNFYGYAYPYGDITNSFAPRSSRIG